MKRKSSKSPPKPGTCKLIRGRGGKRLLCYTGKGVTGWQFKKASR